MAAPPEPDPRGGRGGVAPPAAAARSRLALRPRAAGRSVLAFHFYAHWFGYNALVQHTEHEPIYLWIFLILLVAAAGVVVVDWWLRLDERRLDARTLAEALRVRRAWAMAGHVGSVADTYSGQIRSEMSWIRQALFHVCPPPSVWADQFRQLDDDQQARAPGDRPPGVGRGAGQTA